MPEVTVTLNPTGSFGHAYEWIPFIGATLEADTNLAPGNTSAGLEAGQTHASSPASGDDYDIWHELDWRGLIAFDLTGINLAGVTSVTFTGYLFNVRSLAFDGSPYPEQFAVPSVTYAIYSGTLPFTTGDHPGIGAGDPHVFLTESLQLARNAFVAAGGSPGSSVAPYSVTVPASALVAGINKFRFGITGETPSYRANAFDAPYTEDAALAFHNGYHTAFPAFAGLWPTLTVVYDDEIEPPPTECDPPAPYTTPIVCASPEVIPALAGFQINSGALTERDGNWSAESSSDARAIFWFETCHIDRPISQAFLSLPMGIVDKVDNPPDCYPAIRGYYGVGPEHPVTGELQPTPGDNIGTYWETAGVTAFNRVDLWSLELAGMAPGTAVVQLLNTGELAERMTGIVIAGDWSQGTGQGRIATLPDLLVCYPEGTGDGSGDDGSGGWGGSGGWDGDNPDGSSGDDGSAGAGGPTHTPAKLNREIALRGEALEAVTRRPERTYSTRLRSSGSRRVEQ